MARVTPCVVAMWTPTNRAPRNIPAQQDLQTGLGKVHRGSLENLPVLRAKLSADGPCSLSEEPLAAVLRVDTRTVGKSVESVYTQGGGCG